MRNYFRNLINNSQAPQTIPMQPLFPTHPISQNRLPVTLQRNLPDCPPAPTVDEIEKITSFQTVQPEENQTDMDKTGLEKYDLLQYIGSVSILSTNYSYLNLMLFNVSLVLKENL